jgi:hypothetical protein
MRDYDASLDQAIAEVVTRPFSSRRQKAGSQGKPRWANFSVSNRLGLAQTRMHARSIDRPPSFPPPGKGPQRTDRSQQLYGLVPGVLAVEKSVVH